MGRHPLTAILAAIAYALWALGAGPALVRHRHDGGRLPHVHVAEMLVALLHGHRHHHDHEAHAHGVTPNDGGLGIVAGDAGDHWHSVRLLGGAPHAPHPAGPDAPSGDATPAAPPTALPAPALHVAQPRAPPASLAS
jgi:hypothetical protein